MLVRKEVTQHSLQSELYSSLTLQAWFAMQKPQLLKVKKDAQLYLGSKQEQHSSLHTLDNHHLKGWCPEKEIYIQKGNGLHHVINWLQAFPECGQHGQRMGSMPLAQMNST